MNKEQKSKFVHEVFENIHTQYDKANNRISFGLQKNWKQELVDKMYAVVQGIFLYVWQRKEKI